MKREPRHPPERKEPGLISRSFSWVMGIIFWLFLSLIVSIIIEWIGIATIWNEQGSKHSEAVLAKDRHYLNQQVIEHSNSVSHWVKIKTITINQWIQTVFTNNGLFSGIMNPIQSDDMIIIKGLKSLYASGEAYFLAIPNITQTFFIRLGIVIFSLPAFILFGMLGMIDGLVERELRRWGGGRESSLVYNLARKSVFPSFIGACVLYLSLPISVNPAWIIMPFVIAFGLSMRITFDRLKKYF